MVVRKRRRRFRKLGQRTRGHGDTKNMRGSGTRGGKGMAGSHKHRWSKYYKKFGTEEKQILSRKIIRAINIDQLLEMLPKLSAAGTVSKEAGMLAIDGSKIGFGKLLSRGVLSEKIVLRKMQASAKAIAKIEKAGGRFEGEKGAETGKEPGEEETQGGEAGEEYAGENETGSEEGAGKSREDAGKTRGKKQPGGAAESGKKRSDAA